MMSTWKKRIAARKSTSKKEKNMELLIIPSHFQCPISLDLMKDPVTLSTGITYDRGSIETWIEGGNNTCPITNQVLKILEPIPNHNMRKMIQQWCVENKDHGIERIPTPRIPVTSSEVLVILKKIESCCKNMQQDSKSCRELVLKMKVMIKESTRNKRCFVTNGAGKILSSTLLAFSEKLDYDVGTMEEILSALTILLPLDGESKSILGSKSSLRCMVWFLKCGSLSSRRNSVFLLNEIMKMEEPWRVEELLKIDGALEALVKLVKEPICPTTTKASLLTIYHMVSSQSSNEKARAMFADLGLVELLIEMLVDCEKSICEKALGILAGICSSEQGRKRAYGYALTIPVLIKKLLRVSDLATEFSVSILWKLGKNEKRENGGVLIEALQVGAFQKLLLLIQVGCSESTKEKAGELLKLLNLHRDRAECIDSLDLKNLKRPF